MNREKAIEQYKKSLKQGDVHAYLVNSCYDRCGHCYMSALPEHSAKAKQINPDDLFHFIDLLRQDKPEGLHIGLSGGDPLLHPDIVRILDTLSTHSMLEVLTSGFALSPRNTKNRAELLKAMARSNARFLVASPDEPYHSITWNDIEGIREYIHEHNYSPRKLGYPSRNADIANKVLLACTIVGGAMMAVDYFSRKYSPGKGIPQAIPIGRAKSLPDAQKQSGAIACDVFEKPGTINISYNGGMQYCMYTCHDGFMNIGELRGITDKDEAIEFITRRLSQDHTFQDMVEHERCYFSNKIRKKSNEPR